MSRRPDDVSSFVTALLPSLSRSLAEQFNVFRVMHHGTHEKQLSNVFAWLFTIDATHELGDAAQRIFLDLVNDSLPPGDQLPVTGYRVTQEVDTRGDEEVDGGEVGMDIADILLTRDDAAVVIENYEISDGHGHGYVRYREHAISTGGDGAVVLLCQRREVALQQDGWEEAIVVTYAEVLERLKEHVFRDERWVHAHPEQHFFIQQMVHQFVEGPAAVSLDDQIDFIKGMCDAGESARYSFSRQEEAAQDFANIVAAHAHRQFEDGRRTLAQVKASLRRFASTTLVKQLENAPDGARLETVGSNTRGLWVWGLSLQRPAPHRTLHLVFGPTAAHVLAHLSEVDVAPDYSRIFVTYPAVDVRHAGHVIQTDVRLDDVIKGLASDDVRLRDAVLALSAV